MKNLLLGLWVVFFSFTVLTGSIWFVFQGTLIGALGIVVGLWWIVDWALEWKGKKTKTITRPKPPDWVPGEYP